jgi:hypothetical protein
MYFRRTIKIFYLGKVDQSIYKPKEESIGTIAIIFNPGHYEIIELN